MTGRARVGVEIIASLSSAAILSRAKLAYHCRIPDSEACTWGKAYFPLTFPIEILVFGIGFFVMLIVIRKLSRRD